MGPLGRAFLAVDLPAQRHRPASPLAPQISPKHERVGLFFDLLRMFLQFATCALAPLLLLWGSLKLHQLTRTFWKDFMM